jgi:hypothetical protein
VFNAPTQVCSIWHDFQARPLQQGYNHLQRLSAPHATAGASLICGRAAQCVGRCLPRAWSSSKSPVGRHHPPCAGDACILPCAMLLPYTLPISPSARDGPSPMQLTGACRLRGSSSPCSCCPCLVQFLKSASLFKSPLFERTESRRHCRNSPNRRLVPRFLGLPTR